MYLHFHCMFNFCVFSIKYVPSFVRFILKFLPPHIVRVTLLAQAVLKLLTLLTLSLEDGIVDLGYYTQLFPQSFQFLSTRPPLGPLSFKPLQSHIIMLFSIALLVYRKLIKLLQTVPLLPLCLERKCFIFYGYFWRFGRTCL